MTEGQPIRKVLLPEILAGQMREKITSGEYSGRLPTLEQLASQNGVSRVTMRNAVQSLVVEGLLEVRQGLGTFVASSSEPITRPRPVVSSFEEDEPTEQIPIEDVCFGLRLYLWTKQRVREIAYSEVPSRENRIRLIQAAGRVMVIDTLADQVDAESPVNPLLTAGIVRTFWTEISEIRKYPTLREALVVAAEGSA